MPNTPRREAELHKITCPYCTVGFAIVQMDRMPDSNAVEVQDFNTPRKCNACGAYFKLRATTKVVGVKIAELGPQPLTTSKVTRT